MSDRSTESLVHELARDLEPVALQSPIRRGLALVFALGALEVAYVAVTFGLNPHLKEMFIDGWFALAFVGLAVATVSGSTAGLAAGIPGRELLRNASGIIAGIAVGTALGACEFGLLRHGFDYGVAPAADWSCFTHSIGYGVLPAAALAWLTMRGWVGRPLAGAALGLVGTIAIGALVTQLGCAAWGPRHVLIGHAGVPVLLAALGAAPLAWLLRWRAH